MTGSLRLTSEERKERKRIQNRQNQRARRDRIKCQKPPRERGGSRQFSIQRWRLNEVDSVDICKQAGERQPLASGGTFAPAPTTIGTREVSLSAANPERDPQFMETPLPSDHLLLHLVAYNVCRGISSNKGVLEIFTSTIDITFPSSVRHAATTPCKWAVLRSTDSNLPATLLPTQLQMNEPHPTWMDFFPFPNVRNNLIRGQLTFDHMLFMQDLVGDHSYVGPCTPRADGHAAGFGTSPPLRENGMILWGEPYLKDSWEANPQFLAKWAWVFHGCHEIYECSDRWRISRGEDPLSAVLPYTC